VGVGVALLAVGGQVGGGGDQACGLGFGGSDELPAAVGDVGDVGGELGAFGGGDE
jgi:hypothetical protein